MFRFTTHQVANIRYQVSEQAPALLSSVYRSLLSATQKGVA